MSDMSFAIAISPDGRLRLSSEEGPGGERVSSEQFERLRCELLRANAAGLVDLSSVNWPSVLPASLSFWRDFVRQFFRTLCHADVLPGMGWADLPCPEQSELQELVKAAPPMTGLEYLSSSLLERLWSELCEYAAESAELEQGGPQAWLRRLNPLAHLVGRVTFQIGRAHV